MELIVSDAEIYVSAMIAEMARRKLSEHAAADIIGVGQSTVNKWKNRKKLPYRSNFARICKLLSSHVLDEIDNEIGLPDDVSYEVVSRLQSWRAEVKGSPDRTGIQKRLHADLQRNRGQFTFMPPERLDANSTRLRPIAVGELVHVPVLTMAQAAKFLPVIHGTAQQFISEINPDDFSEWDDIPIHNMIIRVSGTADEPELSHNSVLEIDTARTPQSGEMVVAKLNVQSEPVVRFYVRDGDTVTLKSVGSQTPSREFEIDMLESNPDVSIFWMYPVVEIKTKPPRWSDS